MNYLQLVISYLLIDYFRSFQLGLILCSEMQWVLRVHVVMRLYFIKGRLYKAINTGVDIIRAVIPIHESL